MSENSVETKGLKVQPSTCLRGHLVCWDKMCQRTRRQLPPRASM